MLEAVILAAGASSRMGVPKALLQGPDGRPFLVRIVETLHAAGVLRADVVTGPHHDAIVAALDQWRPAGLGATLRNPRPEAGQLSSLLVGLAQRPPDAPGMLVTLVDVPMVSVHTVRLLLDAWTQTRAPIVRPRVGATHGHPVIFGRQTFQALREAPLHEGAKAVVRGFTTAAGSIAVDDQGCLVDVDTPSEYRALLEGR